MLYSVCEDTEGMALFFFFILLPILTDFSYILGDIMLLAIALDKG